MVNVYMHGCIFLCVNRYHFKTCLEQLWFLKLPVMVPKPVVSGSQTCGFYKAVVSKAVVCKAEVPT